MKGKWNCQQIRTLIDNLMEENDLWRGVKRWVHRLGTEFTRKRLQNARKVP
jgi:hypothetical protein